MFDWLKRTKYQNHSLKICFTTQRALYDHPLVWPLQRHWQQLVIHGTYLMHTEHEEDSTAKTTSYEYTW